MSNDKQSIKSHIIQIEEFKMIIDQIIQFNIQYSKLKEEKKNLTLQRNQKNSEVDSNVTKNKNCRQKVRKKVKESSV